MKNGLFANYSDNIENLIIKRGGANRLASMLAGIALTAIATFSTASAQVGSCGVTQLTSSTYGESTLLQGASSSEDGSTIVFSSFTDHTGQNPEHNYEVFIREMSNGITQITDTGASDTSFAASISGDGKKIVFESTGNFTGLNPDANYELFLYEIDSKIFTQITNTTEPGFNPIGVLSRDGMKVAFSSPRNINGGNPDQNIEAFIYDVGSQITTQLTTKAFTQSWVYSISGDGSRIGVMSNADLVPTKNSDLNTEVFLYDALAGFIQLTMTTGSAYSWGPMVSDDGMHVLYASNVVTPGNPDGNAEAYIRDLTNDSLTRITTTVGIGTQAIAISGDGSRAVLMSTLDLTGQNTDGNQEIFLYERSTGKLTQISDTDGNTINLDVDISPDGKRIFWDSTGYPNGNADGNREVFMYECQPAPVADVKVSLGVSNLNPKQGDKITYTITVANSGPSTAANIVVNDMLSAGTTFVSAQVNKGSFTAPVVGQSGTLVWHPGDMTSGSSESAQIKVTVIVKGKTTVTNTATVSSDSTDPSPANNSASVTVSIASGTSKK